MRFPHFIDRLLARAKANALDLSRPVDFENQTANVRVSVLATQRAQIRIHHWGEVVGRHGDPHNTV
jgi:hypothetical protein